METETRIGMWKEGETEYEFVAAAGPVVLYRATTEPKHPQMAGGFLLMFGAARCHFSVLDNRMLTFLWGNQMHYAIDESGIGRCWTMGASNMSSAWYAIGALGQALLVVAGVEPEQETDSHGRPFFRVRPDDDLAPETVVLP